jgi:hypothetical protein
MNIETIRAITIPKSKSDHVLHIGEDNALFWLDSYLYGNFAKVFWTSPQFYQRGYDISQYTNATVTKYTTPAYFFLGTNLKPDGTLMSGPDESYRYDMSFRYGFDTARIKAVVIDHKPSKKEEVKLFLDSMESMLKLIDPNIVYVRAELADLVREYATKKGLFSEFNFETAMVRTLNATGNYSCAFEVFTKAEK